MIMWQRLWPCSDELERACDRGPWGIVDLNGATTTRIGLKVRADRDRSRYARGVEITVKHLTAIPLRQHDDRPGKEDYRALPPNYR